MSSQLLIALKPKKFHCKFGDVRLSSAVHGLDLNPVQPMLKKVSFRVSVRLGEHRISTERDCDDPTDPFSCNRNDPPIQDIAVEEVIAHKNFQRRLKFDNIALIRLISEPIFAGVTNVEPICLPLKPDQAIYNIAAKERTAPWMIICGWGGNQTSNQLSDVLMQAKVPYVDNEKCFTSIEHISIQDTQLVQQKLFRKIRNLNFTSLSVLEVSMKRTLVWAMVEVL